MNPETFWTLAIVLRPRRCANLAFAVRDAAGPERTSLILGRVNERGFNGTLGLVFRDANAGLAARTKPESFPTDRPNRQHFDKIHKIT